MAKEQTKLVQALLLNMEMLLIKQGIFPHNDKDWKHLMLSQNKNTTSPYIQREIVE